MASSCNTIRPINCPSPSNWAECRPWDMTESKDSCFVEEQLISAVEVAGAMLNVHKLLGVHEQTRLLDTTGHGTPVSSGDHPLHPASNAFNQYNTMWKSGQVGDSVILRSYIGYNFGNVKLPNGRDRYSSPAPQRYNISTIRIKQSPNQSERVTKVRVERSDNGTEWFGVEVVTLPDNDALNTIHFKQTVPSQYWRLRPLQFAGESCTSWGVQALEMHEYVNTRLDNIEDRILFENRNRDYEELPISIKGYYSLVAPLTILTRFGNSIAPTTYTIKIPFLTCVSKFGRPVVIGDIIELPSETQYTPDLAPIKRYLEVTDVTWDPDTYTPGWQPTMLLVTASPALASQETQDIFGDLTKSLDTSGLFNNDDGNAEKYQDYTAIAHTIANQSNTEVPKLGSEGSNTVREFTSAEIKAAAPYANLNRLNFERTQLYVEDALPQNGEDYTEGAQFPADPVDKQYHRITYEGAAKDVPARLYRYSETKGRWIYLETDRRSQFDDNKPILQEYLRSPTGKPARNIK